MPKSSKILSQNCQICGAPAEYSYFGAISCHPCKMFFRRNADAKRTKLVCDFDGRCEININNRHVCSACRLIKCFKVGMSTDKFRASMVTVRKKKSSKKVQETPEKLQTLNILHADQSLLTAEQWTLLTNLFHCFQESRILSKSLILIDKYDTSQNSFHIDTASVDDFLKSIYETASAYLCSNGDFRNLPIDERSIMLRSAANNVACISGTFMIQFCHLLDLDGFLNTLIEKYGKRTMDIHFWAHKYVDHDIVLIKLSIALFAFSENNCCYTDVSQRLGNPKYIFEIQNKYAEITWKYLLYRYGYHESVKRFLNLTLWLTTIHILVAHGQTLLLHLRDIDAIVELTETILIFDDIEEMFERNQ